MYCIIDSVFFRERQSRPPFNKIIKTLYIKRVSLLCYFTFYFLMEEAFGSPSHILSSKYLCALRGFDTSVFNIKSSFETLQCSTCTR